MLSRVRGYIRKIPIKLIMDNQKINYSERRRRKGDGTKTDIFEEKSAASQDEYFRRESAKQLEKIRDEQNKKAEKEGKIDDKQEKINEEIKEKNDCSTKEDK